MYDNKAQEELNNKLIAETDESKINDIINMFNVNIRKKDILRASKLSDLQDKISEQMSERIIHKANEFSNKDLLEYFKTIQDTIENSSDLATDAPVGIQINQQNNVAVYNDKYYLNKESRDKVLSAVQSILGKYSSEASDNLSQVEIIEDIK
jgi:hypothetical protein